MAENEMIIAAPTHPRNVDDDDGGGKIGNNHKSSRKKDNNTRINEEREEELDEEQKKERFFALINNMHDAYERLLPVHEDDDEGNKRRKKMRRTTQPNISIWKPTFQLEDFMTSDNNLGLNKSTKVSNTSTIMNLALTSTGCIAGRKEDEERVKAGALDLGLSL